jgi:splicing factor 3A subunit 1
MTTTTNSSTPPPSADDDLGILQPPPDMKAIIDKTAAWVARHGSSFEQKVKEKQKEASQFSFLRAGNPYYAYYQQKVREIRRVEVIAEVGDKESVENAAEIKMQVKKTLLGEIPLESELEQNRAKPKKRTDMIKKENLEPPPKELWVLEKPNISALQDDIIKLSAQFVARNGRPFQNGLFEREHKYSQFGFLQPYHPLHQYFKKLVADYTRILLPERGTLDRLSELASDKQNSPQLECSAFLQLQSFWYP